MADDQIEHNALKDLGLLGLVKVKLQRLRREQSLVFSDQISNAVDFDVVKPVNGRYQCIERIGKGAFGVALLAVDLDMSKQGNHFQALKVIKFTAISDYMDEVREARTMAAVQHFNIVKFHETFTYKKHLAIVMEYCAQGDLAGLIKQWRSVGDSWKPDVRIIADLAYQISVGLAFIHRKNIVHRDMKPSNIFLSHGVVKIADFGIARKLRPDELASTCCGSPCYMSPEVISHQAYNASTDIWSFGCILYEISTSKVAYVGDSFEAVRALICKGPKPILDPDTYSPELAKLLDRMLLPASSRSTAADIEESQELCSVRRMSKTILLVGSAGSGKSSLGNLLSGSDNAFQISDGITGCTKEHLMLRVNHEHIAIIDTVGANDANDPPPILRHKIYQAMEAAYNGVDCIVFCLRLGRFSTEQIATFQTMLALFGEECQQNLIVVLTYAGRLLTAGNDVQNVWIQEQRNAGGETAAAFIQLLNACGGRIVFVENPAKDEDAEQEAINRKKRTLSREQLMQTISVMNSPKFELESIRRAKEEQKRREEAEKAANEKANRLAEELALANKRRDEELERIDQERRAEIEKVREQEQRRVERIQIHEYFCLRRECSNWRSLLVANIGMQGDLWNSHILGCANCRRCEMCRLENMGERSDEDLLQLENLHEAEIAALKRKEKRCFIQ